MDGFADLEIVARRGYLRPRNFRSVEHAAESVESALAFARARGLTELVANVTPLKGFPAPTIAERFWIIHAPENGASQAGIEKAGFRVAGELSFRRNEGAGLLPGDLPARARTGAALLGVPLIEEVMILTAQEEPLAPCWHCVINARESGAGDSAVECWPEAPALTAAQPCTCGCG